MMVLACRGGSYFINEARRRPKYGDKKEFNFEAPLTHVAGLADLDRLGHAVFTCMSWSSPRSLEDSDGESTDTSLWWKLSSDHLLRHAGGGDHSGVGQGLHVAPTRPTSAKSSRRRSRAARR